MSASFSLIKTLCHFVWATNMYFIFWLNSPIFSPQWCQALWICCLHFYYAKSCRIFKFKIYDKIHCPLAKSLKSRPLWKVIVEAGSATCIELTTVADVFHAFSFSVRKIIRIQRNDNSYSPANIDNEKSAQQNLCQVIFHEVTQSLDRQLVSRCRLQILAAHITTWHKNYVELHAHLKTIIM